MQHDEIVFLRCVWSGSDSRLVLSPVECRLLFASMVVVKCVLVSVSEKDCVPRCRFNSAARLLKEQFNQKVKFSHSLLSADGKSGEVS